MHFVGIQRYAVNDVYIEWVVGEIVATMQRGIVNGLWTRRVLATQHPIN